MTKQAAHPTAEQATTNIKTTDGGATIDGVTKTATK